MKTASKITTASMLCLFLIGCGFVQSKDGLTIDQKAELVKSTASTAIFVAIREIHDDKAQQTQKATEIKAELENTVLPLLSDRNATVDENTEKLLMVKIPPEYRAYLQSAVTMLRTYYTTPKTGDVLSDSQWKILNAFFSGLLNGANLVIEANEEE